MAIEPLVLKFRTADAGGELRSLPDMEEFYRKWDKSRLVLLIHGFNNTVAEARDAYENGFFRVQRELANHAPGGDFAPDRDFVEVFWKGDDWGSLSGLYYMGAIPYAVQTAQALADVLRRLASQRAEGLDVQIVAHSLGTRLTLELLRHLGADRNVRVDKLVFFAAATPTFMLDDDDGELRQAYDTVVQDGGLSFYSGNDVVLSWAFPIGQTLAPGEEGLFPTALGHERWESPRVPPTLEQQENRNADHSDYWGWKQERPQCEQHANAKAREYLGFTGGGDRGTESATSALRETPVLESQSAREIGSRETPTRSV